ncbi:Uncharacterised protein [Mycobacteroides abscessus subsp. abscessus]|nr:Uncharacterised protein [Mycobacteroides abscessus subsp. abscessus]
MNKSRNSGTKSGRPAAAPAAASPYQMPRPRPAINRLLSGPASETDIPASLGFLKWKRFTGTGRAQPNPAIKIRMVPRGSRWWIGLSVSRPCFCAVGSPNL